MSGSATHNKVKQKLADELLKFAGKISEQPYNLEQGSIHLRQWLDGTFEKAPVLDTSYIYKLMLFRIVIVVVSVFCASLA